MPLGMDFFNDFWFFWSKMEASWDQNRSKIDVNFERRFFEKTLFFQRKNHDFEGSGGRSWVQKSTKNRSKNGVQDGMHLGIDFWTIFLDFGCQVGRQIRWKINQKSHRKNDTKNKAVWDASWAVFGLSRAPRRTPTQSNATQRAGNPLPGAARAAALSRKNT